MTVIVNGEPRDLAPGSSVSELLEALALNPKTVVAQLNDDIVERGQFDATVIQDGDRLELVRFVGGG